MRRRQPAGIAGTKEYDQKKKKKKMKWKNERGPLN